VNFASTLVYGSLRNDCRNLMAKKVKEREEGPEKFEVHLEKLRSIVEKLEQGDQSLDQNLKLFEEGVGLTRKLFDILNRSEARVEELLSTMEKAPFTAMDE
jgi:exodeoxyribonuclease VII small subunit